MPSLNQHFELDRCPACNVHQPRLERKWNTSTNRHNGQGLRYWEVYQCDACGTLITAYANHNPQSPHLKEAYDWFPKGHVIDESIPYPAKDYLEQATETLHAPAASIIVAASAIDAMLKICGYEKGNLYTRIKKAAEDHLITSEMAKWAHQVRLEANSERHADKKEELPKESDSRRTLEFALALAQFLFVLPSKVDKGLAETAPDITEEPKSPG